MSEGIQKEHAALLEAYKQLHVQCEAVVESKQALETENVRLESENVRLESENVRLESENVRLETEYSEQWRCYTLLVGPSDYDSVQNRLHSLSEPTLLVTALLCA